MHVINCPQISAKLISSNPDFVYVLHSFRDRRNCHSEGEKIYQKFGMEAVYTFIHIKCVLLWIYDLYLFKDSHVWRTNSMRFIKREG